MVSCGFASGGAPSRRSVAGLGPHRDAGGIAVPYHHGGGVGVGNALGFGARRHTRDAAPRPERVVAVRIVVEGDNVAGAAVARLRILSRQIIPVLPDCHGARF